LMIISSVPSNFPDQQLAINRKSQSGVSKGQASLLATNISDCR